ncbi:hypothetical protein HQ945_19375 [Phyllobacterium sp. BT25]|uniref:Uncharacterized protein n=1 Tax=Phyllobacterium pellucidum TaxID=2740464 RepID=A0A849VTZ5_9HYPH|nr:MULTISPECIES: hypothetical protein [Phyllobacterium]NTS33421.1 hypothetical protein [Phyllobacterium pellucidum]SFJ39370.1 hypothetical protein SAMN04515648_3807 [Phyllobacterium sp. CL33Tsu]
MSALARSVGLIFFALTTVAHGASQTTQVGGSGGSPFKILCPPNHVLIGFNMRTGSALDAIAPACKRLKADGTTLMPISNPGATGGNGGHSNRVNCMGANTFVARLNVFVDRFEIVNHIEIQCRTLANSAPSGVFRPQEGIGGQAVRSFTVECQTGHIPNGIIGRSGALIDRLGLHCDASSVIAPRQLEAIRRYWPY